MKKRILLVAGGYVQAGVSRVLSLIAAGLKSQGHEVDVYFIKPVGQWPYPLEANVVHVGGAGAGCRLVQVAGLWRFLKRYGGRYDRIIGFSEDANVPLVRAAHLSGLADRVILSVHNPVDKFSRRVRGWVARYYPLAHKVLGVSRGVVSDLEALGIPEDKLLFRPNPVDLNSIMSASDLKPPILLEKDVFNFVAMGRLHSHKGFDLLLEAFSRVARFGLGARLTILGEGEERASLEQQIGRLGLKGLVSLPGSVQNPFSVMAQADCFVLSSRLEGWPMVLMEAMAVGLPVVAFRCPHGPDEIVEDGVSGLLVENGNIEALERSMQCVMSDDQLRSRLASGARRRVQVFDYRSVAATWLV